MMSHWLNVCVGDMLVQSLFTVPAGAARLQLHGL